MFVRSFVLCSLIRSLCVRSFIRSFCFPFVLCSLIRSFVCSVIRWTVGLNWHSAVSQPFKHPYKQFNWQMFYSYFVRRDKRWTLYGLTTPPRTWPSTVALVSIVCEEECRIPLTLLSCPPPPRPPPSPPQKVGLHCTSHPCLESLAFFCSNAWLAPKLQKKWRPCCHDSRLASKGWIWKTTLVICFHGF